MHKQQPVAIVSIGAPWFDIPAAEQFLKETWTSLRDDYTLVGREKVITDSEELEEAILELRQHRVQALLLQIGAFPDGNAPARLAQALRVPVIIHALPEPNLTDQIALNSLCGANMATYTLSALELPHTSVYGNPGAPDVKEKLKAHISAALVLSQLEETKIGLVGFRAPGFYPCAFDELLLRRKLGVAVNHIGLNALTEALRENHHKPSPHDVFPTIEGGELSKEAVNSMERYYGALSATVEASGATVIAIKDWPEIEHFDPEVPGGFWPALSWIQDDGIHLAPEGDVNGAVTMAIEHALTGTFAFFADISAWDGERSTLLLWHYGGAPSLARDKKDIRFGQEGREVEFTLKPGQATLARLGLHQGALRLLTIAVDIQDQAVTLRRAAGHAHTTSTPAGEVVRYILDNGWEHHVCLIYGDVREQFRALSKFTGIPLSEL